MFITVKNLSKEFVVKVKGKGIIKKDVKRIVAVNNVSFNIEKGETIAFIGPNGAGKSTTIKMLTGIIQPTKGQISVAGFNPSIDRKKLAYKIGCMFGQKSQLYLHLSVLDSFKLLACVYDIKSEDIDDRIEYIAKLFKIEELLNLTVRKLSLGQRMICEIAGSILHKPEILFLDEPTIGLDIIAKHRIREIIKMLNEKENVTVFLTSHDANDVDAICNRIIVIDGGRVIIDSSTSDIKKEYLSKKKIKINYDNSISNINFDHELTSKDEYSVEFLIDTRKEKIATVLSKFISIEEVNDIQIEETPMEEIIKKIYEERNKYE
jgi:ABC-2 type transport system ATP-binding protein